MVWFWLGVIVAVGGALFAIWPTPEGRRRRVSDVYGARLARELNRARSRGAGADPVLELLIAIVLLAAVAAWISVPLRRAGGQSEPGLEDPVIAELEARKQAKYREIRDTELDHAQEKLSDEEFARQDAELRREAIAILKEIDAAEAERPGETDRSRPGRRRRIRLDWRPPWRRFSE